MDPERARIQADLSGQIDGSVECDDLALEMYSTDASIYQQRPLGVVRPTSVEDVVACVNYARANQLSVIPRGAGSNTMGSCLGPGLVLDFSYSMRRIVKVDRDTVTVQPGLVLAELNRELSAHDRLFGPDPLIRSVSTMGGVLSMNSTGSHWTKYGDPRDQVVSLDVVTANGEFIQLESARNLLSRGSTMVDSETTVSPQPEVARDLERKLTGILRTNEALIEESRPNVRMNQAGYNVFDAFHDSNIDLTRILVGSEGTLGIITQATLLTEPKPRHRGVALMFFHRLETAAKAAVEISKMGVVACDMLDRRLLSFARETRGEFTRLIPSEAEAMLLVEFQDVDDSALRQKLAHLQTRIHRRKKLAFEVRLATQEAERDLFWRLTRRVIPSLYRLKGTQRAIPFIDDIAIDPAKLPEFVGTLHQVLNDNEVTASIFSHTPQGLIHLRPFLNLSDEKDLLKMQRLANQVFEKVNEIGGTISGSQGDGLSRTWYLHRQYGKLLNVFSDIKNTFDPQNILNPGKIVGQPYSALTDNVRHLNLAPAFVFQAEGAGEARFAEERVQEAPSGMKSEPPVKPAKPAKQLTVLQPNLNWVLPEIGLAARNCNGCGRCRTTNPKERMCPVFRLAPREEASPRAKANLMRGVLTGSLDPAVLSQDEFKEIADLCVNCHQCRFECPAGVDIPKLMVEAKSQYYALNGLKLSDWLLTRLDWLYELAGRMPRVTNRLITTPMFRWLLDRLLGVAQGRKLPRFANRSLIRWATKEKLTRPSKQQSRKVVYFVDAYANWNDVELGRAFVRVLQHNGIDVLIPPGQGISGMSLISEGAIDQVRKLASRNVEMLAEWIRQGYQVVTTEPSAALVLTHEYLNMMDDADTELVASNTVESSSYLWQLHQAGDLELDFTPLNASIGYHLPCHQRALLQKKDDDTIPGVKLLRLIPGLQVEQLEQGCSGMAGTYGLKRKNYNRSLRMGMPLINAMRSPSIIAGTTECSACKIQMEQGTTKPTIHPVKILALAYGLLPELEDLFNRRSEELTVT
jgi:FAD/FMN-containing dehydrogenase/Fe-S oxidoreductase